MMYLVYNADLDQWATVGTQ